MAILDLGNVSENIDDDRYFASMRLRAVLAWPNDEKSRNGFLAGFQAHNLAILEEVAKAGEHDADVLRAARTRPLAELHRVGGFAALRDASSWDNSLGTESDHARKYFTAGKLLTLVWQMTAHDFPGGPSINKAIHCMEMVKGDFHLHNAKDIRKAWADYKPVAHLSAALMSLAGDGPITQIGTKRWRNVRSKDCRNS